MDIKQLVGAMSPEERLEATTYFTMPELIHGLSNQAMADVEVVPVPEEPDATFPVAEPAPAPAGAETLRAVALADFLYPEAEIPLDKQLAFMTKFLAERNLNVAQLSAEQMARLEAKMANPENRGMRVVPTLVGDLSYLTDIGWSGEGKADLSLQENGILAKIKANSGKPARKGKVGASYGLFYKTPSGLVDHAGLEKYLLESGEGVRDPETGRVWTFPIVDMRVPEKTAKAKAGEVYDRIDPAVLPATVVTKRMLRGESGNPREYDVCNAGIYKVDGNGAPVALDQVVTVNKDYHGVTRLYEHNLDGHEIPVSPRAVSGLRNLEAA